MTLALSGCSAPPELTVGDVPFHPSDLHGLSATQIDRLTELASIGLAVSRDELPRLGAGVVQEFTEDRRIERLRQEVLLEAAGVDDAVLEARYTVRPEFELEVRHLVRLSERFETAAEREEAREEAESARARADAGEAFDKLAGELSEEPGAESRGGLLEPGRAGTWVEEFWEASSALDVGEISGVVETPYGFHVIQLLDRRPLEFEEARDRVAQRVASEIPDSGAWESRLGEWAGSGAPEALADASNPEHEAVRDRLQEEADARGIRLSDAQEAALLRRWETMAQGWAALLGFRSGMTPAETARQSRAALGATGQNARIARDQIAEWGDELRSVYPIERAGA